MDEQQQELLKLTSNLSLLYVEDEDSTREQYEDIFKLLFGDVKSTVNGKEALEEYKNKSYDLVVTDITMPKMDGLTLIGEIIKINPLQKIIIMSAHNSNKVLKESINYHIDGFLLKPVPMENLFRLLYKVCSDLNHKSKAIQHNDIHQTIEHSLNSSKSFFIVVIDNFYDLIKRFDSDIKESIYKSTDEYLSNIGLENLTVMNEHKDVFICSIDKNKFQNILKTLQRFSLYDNYIILARNKIKIYITLSYGIVSLDYEKNEIDKHTLMVHVNNLIHDIKHDHSSNKVVKMDINYEEAKKNTSLNWLKFIIDALQKENIVPFYQPIIDSNTHKINSYQVLARIEDKGEYILPKFFIDISIKAGLIEDISKAIIEHSYKVFSTNKESFHIDVLDIRWRKGTLEDYLNHLTHKYNIDRCRVILDIQDYSSLKSNSEKTKTILNLKRLGYKISLKDFVAANINIELLSLLKPDYIKINKILVHNSQNDPHLKEALDFLMQYTNKVGIKTIVVGIENRSMLEKAKSFGFGYLQGFYIAKPDKELLLKNKPLKR